MPNKKRVIHVQHETKTRVITTLGSRRVLQKQFYTGYVEKDNPYHIWQLLYFIRKTWGLTNWQIDDMSIDKFLDRLRRARAHIAKELENQQRREAIVWWQDYNLSRIKLALNDLDKVYGYKTEGTKGLSTMWAYTDIDSKLYNEKMSTAHQSEVKRHINTVHRNNRPILEMENVTNLEKQEAAHRISCANGYKRLLNGEAQLVDDDKLLFIARAAVDYERGNLSKVMEAAYPEFKDKVMAELNEKYKLEPKDVLLITGRTLVQ
jgi:hypothetical protein